jgi:hypothetical protein
MAGLPAGIIGCQRGRVGYIRYILFSYQRRQSFRCRQLRGEICISISFSHVHARQVATSGERIKMRCIRKLGKLLDTIHLRIRAKRSA